MRVQLLTKRSLPGACALKERALEKAKVHDVKRTLVGLEMMERGIRALTGETKAIDAWRHFIKPDDVVGIKVNPVGQPHVISSAEVFQEIVEGLKMAGVKTRDIVAYDRYEDQFLSGGFKDWLPEGAAPGNGKQSLRFDGEGLPVLGLRGLAGVDDGGGHTTDSIYATITEVAQEAGARIVGVDMSFSVEQAYENVGKLPNVDIVQADLLNLPFKEGVFDTVFSLGVLHHTSNCHEAFKAVAKLPKTGGSLAVWWII